MKTAKDYMYDEYGGTHIYDVGMMGDTKSLYDLMDEFAEFHHSEKMREAMPSEFGIKKAIENHIAKGGNYFTDELAKCVMSYLSSLTKEQPCPK